MNEPLITEKRKPQLKELVNKLKTKVSQPDKASFSQSKVLRAHILPLTNVSFNKTGSHFITGSYDRTAKIWETDTGNLICTLEGHKNVVYAITFNLPFSDRIATGSFDKTACLWNAETGERLQTLSGHSAEVVCIQFSSNGKSLATGSMDTVAKVWDAETGKETATLAGHTAEVIALQFTHGGYGAYDPNGGQILLTGSFDHTACLWDVRTASRISHLRGHTAEVAAAACTFDGRLVATASMDKTVRVWDTRTRRPLYVLTGHDDEVLDVAFDPSGRQLASSSADSTAILWDATRTGSEGEARQMVKLVGHDGEVSKVLLTITTSST
ncbi:hypothetical protein AAHC03_016736 [Spirometra sp. Aus1]